jgi:DNA-binding XRE family transcriptional regulator
MSVSAAQMKAARAVLDWKQKDFAAASGLSLNTIRSIERGHLSPRFATGNAIRRTIENAGLELLSDDGIKRRDDLVQIYKGKCGCDDFFEDLFDDLRKRGDEVAIAIHAPETLSWFFSTQNATVLERLNQPAAAPMVKCLLSEASASPFVTPSFELRLTFKQNVARLPLVISGNKYTIIAHVDDSSPPYLVSFRIPRASRAYFDEFRLHWKDGQRVFLPESPGRRKRGRV